jgi:hypothetical protein
LFQAIDSKCCPAPLGGEASGKSPVDRRKRGSKVHVLVDQRGAPLSLHLTGANVHVRSGSGATNNNAAPFTRFWNLIIGYNENTSPTPTLARTGSNNLVGGGMNSFSSVGGLVFGFQNTISGSYASILGGSVNTAAGPNSTVYGGASQTAANLNSYVPVQGARPAPGQ